MISSGEKKALSIIAIVVVLFVAVVGTSVFLLTRNAAHDDQPYLHVAVGDELHTVDPRWWCDLMLTACDPEITAPNETATVPVPVGSPIPSTPTSRGSMIRPSDPVSTSTGAGSPPLTEM